MCDLRLEGVKCDSGGCEFYNVDFFYFLGESLIAVHGGMSVRALEPHYRNSLSLQSC